MTFVWSSASGSREILAQLRYFPFPIMRLRPPYFAKDETSIQGQKKMPMTHRLKRCAKFERRHFSRTPPSASVFLFFLLFSSFFVVFGLASSVFCLFGEDATARGNAKRNSGGHLCLMGKVVLRQQTSGGLAPGGCLGRKRRPFFTPGRGARDAHYDNLLLTRPSGNGRSSCHLPGTGRKLPEVFQSYVRSTW